MTKTNLVPNSVEPITQIVRTSSRRIRTPWLALNQKNFAEYTRTRNQIKRREKLESTIVGNCLGMCKSLGIFFKPDPATGERPFITVTAA